MVWTAWNNGSHHATGVGYGFRVRLSDRDRYFKREWRECFIELPEYPRPVLAKVKLDKSSFWGPHCSELISKEIGRWLINRGYAPWPKGKPPRFEVEAVRENVFRILVDRPEER